jgi:hypothetical protein
MIDMIELLPKKEREDGTVSKDLEVAGYGVSVKVRYANSFKNSAGETIEYDDAIVIDNGKKSVALTAMQFAVVKEFLAIPEVVTALQERFEQEQEALKGVGF